MFKCGKKLIKKTKVDCSSPISMDCLPYLFTCLRLGELLGPILGWMDTVLKGRINKFISRIVRKLSSWDLHVRIGGLPYLAYFLLSQSSLLRYIWIGPGKCSFRLGVDGVVTTCSRSKTSSSSRTWPSLLEGSRMSTQMEYDWCTTSTRKCCSVVVTEL